MAFKGVVHSKMKIYQYLLTLISFKTLEHKIISFKSQWGPVFKIPIQNDKDFNYPFTINQFILAFVFIALIRRILF